MQLEKYICTQCGKWNPVSYPCSHVDNSISSFRSRPSIMSSIPKISGKDLDIYGFYIPSYLKSPIPPVPPPQPKDLWELWKCVSHISFVQKKTNGYTNLYSLDELNSIFSEIFKHGYKNSTSHIQGSGMNSSARKTAHKPVLDFDHYEYMGLVDDLLRLCKGHLFLCGGGPVSMVADNIQINDYDLFFVCDSVEEADRYLKLCLERVDEYISEYDVPNCRFVSNCNVITINLSHTVFQFIRRLYISPNQILDGFDLPACKIGYGYLTEDCNKCDIFTNIEGGLSILTMSFPINCNQITTSHSSRIDKYRNKGFDILIPGVREDVIEFKSMDIHFTKYNSGNIQNNEDNKYGWTMMFGGCEDSDYNTKYSPQSPDKQVSATNRILNTPHMVKYHSPNAVSLMDVTCDTIIDKTCDVRMNIDYFTNLRYTKDHAKYIMGDKYEEWIIAMFLDDDSRKCAELWELRMVDVKDMLKSAAIRSKHCGWKVKNPGDQFFGKLNPLKHTPKEFYGCDYIPFYAGINPDLYVVVLQWLLSYGLNQDLVSAIFREIVGNQIDCCLEYLGINTQ